MEHYARFQSMSSICDFPPSIPSLPTTFDADRSITALPSTRSSVSKPEETAMSGCWARDVRRGVFRPEQAGLEPAESDQSGDRNKQNDQP